LHFPGGPGVRIDSHLYAGYSIPPHYDSLVAKIIVHAPTREEAIDRMKRALGETVIEGPGLKTTVPFHLKVMDNAFYRRGAIFTNFVATRMID
jgi:acetyl-CoA carboxylase biotin carboxylase subunit